MGTTLSMHSIRTAFDKAMTNEQRQKYEDEELKKAKKPPGKK